MDNMTFLAEQLQTFSFSSRSIAAQNREYNNLRAARKVEQHAAWNNRKKDPIHAVDVTHTAEGIDDMDEHGESYGHGVESVGDSSTDRHQVMTFHVPRSHLKSFADHMRDHESVRHVINLGKVQG
jgi:hypothetical protein